VRLSTTQQLFSSSPDHQNVICISKMFIFLKANAHPS